MKSSVFRCGSFRDLHGDLPEAGASSSSESESESSEASIGTKQAAEYLAVKLQTKNTRAASAAVNQPDGIKRSQYDRVVTTTHSEASDGQCVKHFICFY